MGHNHNKNYSKFSEQKQNTVVVDKTSILSDEEVKELKPEDVIDVVETENGQLAFAEVIENSVTKGHVVNCERLNIRKEAEPDAEVVCVIEKGSEVILESQIRHNGFYKVVTASGAEGYCMSDYIEVE